MILQNIAKRVSVLGDEIQLRQVIRGIEHMSDLALLALKNVLDSYARRDVEARSRSGAAMKKIDAVNNSLLRELLTYDRGPAQHRDLHPSDVLHQEY